MKFKRSLESARGKKTDSLLESPEGTQVYRQLDIRSVKMSLDFCPPEL